MWRKDNIGYNRIQSECDARTVLDTIDQVTDVFVCRCNHRLCSAGGRESLQLQTWRWGRFMWLLVGTSWHIHWIFPAWVEAVWQTDRIHHRPSTQLWHLNSSRNTNTDYFWFDTEELPVAVMLVRWQLWTYISMFLDVTLKWLWNRCRRC